MTGKETFETKGLTGKEEIVEKVKEKAAELYDLFEMPTTKEGAADGGRLIALAKTNLEQSIMWFTKGVSRLTPNET